MTPRTAAFPAVALPQPPPVMILNRLGLLRALALPFAVVFTTPGRAQIPVNFSVTAAGVKKAIPNWGLDTNWANLDNMRRGIAFMGRDNVNVVRVPGMVDQPADSGLTTAQKAHMQDCINYAALASPTAKWDMCAPGSDSVNAWYQTGVGTVSVDRWVQALKLCQQYYNHPMWIVEPFNEPDYATWGEGSTQNLYDIMGGLQSADEFKGSLMAGGSTMSTDQAAKWFDALGSRVSVGTTHGLYGSVDNYVGFIQHVAAKNGMPLHPEGHNVVEAIIGAEYGLQGMIWWGTAELARGNFLKYSQGDRLGYAEDRPNWTAAAVYRAPSGAVQAFLGSSERVGGSTTYTFHSTDRDVYYDGHGPQRDYTVTIARNQERVISITWGADPAPVVGGRYAIVNVGSGLCLDVTGASTAQGAALQQSAFTGAKNQLWDVTPLAANGIGDLSYFVITDANSGLNIDVPEWHYEDEWVMKQYGYPANAVEHWYFDYAGNGKFYIRSRWSNKCLCIAGSSGSVGAAVVQRGFAGTPDQLWKLQDPAKTPVAAPLAITAQPQSVIAAPGQTMTFSATAVGTGKLSYQWLFNGAPIADATSSRLLLSNVQVANIGSYSVTISDALTSTTSSSAALTLDTTTDVGRITNLSIRSIAGAGDQTLTVGFGIGGAAGTQPVLIRGIGPTLSVFGLPGAIEQPKVNLYGSAGLIQSAGAWGGVAAVADVFKAVSAFGLDASAQDVAFLPTLPDGTYTAQISNAKGTPGVALMELYDATPAGTFDPSTSPRLINASARSQVGTGDNILIAGFAIAGSTARTVLIRAIGPTLALFNVSGTLASPLLELVKDKVTVASNSGWGGDSQFSTIGTSVGAFGLPNAASPDSALLVTLTPGTYSAKVSGADGGTGVALVEVYDVP